jgi:hypothetical protein
LQTIELDCPPGPVRPGDYIGNVLRGTGLEIPETSLRFFGCWTWEFDVPDDVWERDIQPVIGPRIETLFHQGAIRYGSW